MLNRRSKREETYDEYFYEKAKLVNRCHIKGKDAVDCIIHGIYDHNVRLNAQGSNFKHPSQLLRYLRSITVKNIRSAVVENKPVPFNKTSTSKIADKLSNQNASRVVKCFNRSEEGHTVPKCPKLLQKCLKCQRMAHLAAHCKRDFKPYNNPSDSNNTYKEVQQITAHGKILNI
ncbi:unnamed protein product [Euphydryas editha]|uniref:CCHC-type domain-containing protein n=1 Tax=Euphydryas editha TaxID=104508 RepID=A0AAU9TPV8_EUPED|nr:unnamed protein product [Euphydryas editha]